jgi:DnaK suppressor protein
MKATTEEVRTNELIAIRESLLSQKSTILNKTNEFKHQHLEAQPLSDESDAASKDVSDSISIRLHERDRTALYMIERALGKISDGTYGQCEGCGQSIGLKRLQARPFTSLCIECMEEHEDNQKTLQ